MLEGMELISYHHTFEYISETLFCSGFYMERILEPKPVEEGKFSDESDYSFTKKIPSFCVIKAIKKMIIIMILIINNLELKVPSMNCI